MLEKLGIRIVTSLICIWFILQMGPLPFQVDFFMFMMMIFYSLLISMIIECGYGLLRRWIHFTPFILVVFLMIIIGIKYWLGWGIYLGLSVYTLLSIGIDLYREFRMTRLLKSMMHNHE